jgi:hypothetical protein
LILAVNFSDFDPDRPVGRRDSAGFPPCLITTKFFAGSSINLMFAIRSSIEIVSLVSLLAYLPVKRRERIVATNRDLANFAHVRRPQYCPLVEHKRESHSVAPSIAFLPCQ